MNQLDMYKAMGEIDDIFLQEAQAEQGSRQKEIPVYKIATAIAACFIFVTIFTLAQFSKKNGIQEDADKKIKQDILAEDSDYDSDMPKLHFSSEMKEIIAADMALPAGAFFADMTQEEIAAIWGGNTWWGEDYSVSGTTIYDGNGMVWIATVNGISQDGSTEFTLQLSPNQLPPECMGSGVTENADNIWGTLVDGSQAHYDYNGDGVEEFVYSVVFLREEEQVIGARFYVFSVNDERASTLMKKAVYTTLDPAEESTFTLSHLKPDTIPEWRLEELTLEEALKEEGFAAYIPTDIPNHYMFEGAWRELGQNKDNLYVSWYDNNNAVSVNIQKLWEERTLTDINGENDYYNASKYKAVDVPDEYWEDYASPVFAEKDVTEELLYNRIRRLEEAGYYEAEFAVQYENHTLVSYRFQGEDPEEIKKMLETIPCMGE